MISFNLFTIFFILCLIAIIVSVVLLTNKKSSTSPKSEGFFDFSFSNETYEEKYEEYVSQAASFWKERVFPVYRISLEISVYSNPNNFVLASAYPRISSNGLARSGNLKINSYHFDKQSRTGKINTIKHEMGHVLGVGYWNFTTSGGNGIRLPGSKYPKTLKAYNDVTGKNFVTGVPLESSGGSGTAGSHWEDNFRIGFEPGKDSYGMINELMTGTINNPAPLSSITLAYLEDIGWKVDISKHEDNLLSFETKSPYDYNISHVKFKECICGTCHGL
jgi:hypothetical protein